MPTNKFDRFRESLGLRQCIHCGKDIKGVKHHFLCDDCWGKDRAKRMLSGVDEAIEEREMKMKRKRRWKRRRENRLKEK